MSIEYIRHFADTGDPAITDSLVECYRNVFADPPWNEWLKCAVCDKYWGRKDMDLIKEMNGSHCGEGLVHYWPAEKVRADITNETQSGKSSCWLAMEGGIVVGFCWGYPVSCADFSKKVELEVDYLPLGLNGSGEHMVALQDEVGVLKYHRGKKIAKELVRLRNLDFVEMGMTHGVVRTRQSPEPSVTYLWYLRLGYRILGSYPDEDGRVIMGIDLAEIT